jgi:4-amino-4-deoxy-L-arabinose transferase-like glycosyltransferase
MLKSQSFKNTVIFALFHAIFFVLLLSILRPIPSLDVPENFFWGKHLEWGYFKHPPLFATISHLLAIVFGASAFTNYLICGVLMFFSFLALYFLAREFLPEDKLFLAILLLEGLTYAGINTRVFNANSVQIPFWILTAFFYLRGIQTKKLIHFGLFGAFLGLGFLGKYFTLLLGFTIFLSFISLKETRNLLKTPLPYFAVLCFFAVIYPHIDWLFKNDFLPIEYAKSKQVRECSFLECRRPFFIFFASSVASFLPLLLGFFALVKNVKFKKLNLKNSKENLLFAVSIFPFAISLLSALIFGMDIAGTWSQPMFFFLPIFLLYFLEFEFRENWKKRLKIYIILCFFSWFCVIVFSGVRDAKFRGQHYKEIQKIALEHTKKWQNEFDKPLKFVAGETLEVGIFFVANPSTIVIPYNNLRFAPYVKKEDVVRDGFLLLQTCNSQDLCIKLEENQEVRDVISTTLRKKPIYIFVIYKKPLAN